MLTYLDALCAALIARDRSALSELLANPRGVNLPSEVRKEIDACLAHQIESAPLRTLHYYYQEMQRARAMGSFQPSLNTSPRESRAVQIELPLSAA